MSETKVTLTLSQFKRMENELRDLRKYKHESQVVVLIDDNSLWGQRLTKLYTRDQIMLEIGTAKADLNRVRNMNIFQFLKWRKS